MENTENPIKMPTVEISKEMKEAYLQYSMSVIVGRALPDVRDGLKPVHRRVLYAMSDLGNHYNKPYKKSARVVGDVIGKYHPHGDSAVYDTIVRMAQDFSMRHPLVDGQGNFGSIDGDSAAAMRYTEIRMTQLAEELLQDIDKETVSFSPNYDDSLMIPDVLPAKYPNLLVNGSTGIAVGMATNIPPHNLGEICDAVCQLIENPEFQIEDLMKIVKGPDFPTSASIVGKKGILDAYMKGRGIISIKAKTEIESLKNGRDRILIHEIPYQVNKARLIENIALLVRDKKVEGISDIRDESNREGIRIVIDLKKDENATVILNRLYKFTQMQVSYGIIMLALDAQGRPRTFNLKSMLEAFANHRRDVVTRRCIYELKKAEARAHILEGLRKALDQIDAVIQEIKAAKDPKVALTALVQKFSFSEKQAQAILEMRLQRLTGLEREKIENELNELVEKMAWLRKVLSDINEINKIIVEELKEIRNKYANERKTSIEGEDVEIDDEDLIAKEDMVVTLTKTGYIKRIPLSQYKSQKRGGKGLTGMQTREEDVVSSIFVANTHTTLMVFTDRGKAFWVKVYKLPQGSRTAKGRAIQNVIELSSGEKIQAILPVKNFEKGFVVFATEKGIVKKTSITQFSRPKQKGIIAINTDLDDKLKEVRLSDGESDVFLATQNGMCIRFHESSLRDQGRNTRGVKGITLAKGDKVVGMSVLPKNIEGQILIVSSQGYGKRVPISEYRSQSRGGVGLITQKTSEKLGFVVATRFVDEKCSLVLITDKGMIMRTDCSGISTIGRNTQGVRIIRAKEGELVSDLAVTRQEDSVVDEDSSSDS